MANSILVSLGILIAFSTACCSIAFANVPPIANTTYGPVRGEAIVLNTNKTLVRFLGIPFAQANRFEAPKSPKPWTRTVNATSFGKWCPQNPSVIMNSTKDIGEDCLTINVFLPEDKAKQNPALLPVMLWIHGGGFHLGGSAAGLYYGGYLATEGEVIVVTFNYRVGVLGFLSTGTSEIPGNFGLLDQVEAMRWVQKNIERCSWFFKVYSLYYTLIKLTSL